jgi:hypothetical protein
MSEKTQIAPLDAPICSDCSQEWYDGADSECIKGSKCGFRKRGVSIAEVASNVSDVQRRIMDNAEIQDALKRLGFVIGAEMGRVKYISANVDFEDGGTALLWVDPNETSPSVDAKENPMKYCDMCSIPSICSERRKCRYVETPAKEKALGPSDATACSPSDTPETDALADEIYSRGIRVSEIRMLEHARKMERERNEEMGYRGQWCDKARKAEAALDALEDLTRELAATKKTLGTLIAWSVLELGEQNTQRLLDMMSSENPDVEARRK